MKKIDVLITVKDRMTNEFFKVGGENLTFRRAVGDSLNLPPAAYPARDGQNPKHAAELRGGIIEKMFEADADAVEFLPEQIDEILFCVSAIQPTTLYMAVKNILDGKSDADATRE